MLIFLFREDGERPSGLQRELVYRQIAWNYVLSRSLRLQDPLAGADAWLAPEEVAALRPQDNVPNALLQTQGDRLQDAHRQELLDRFFFVSRTLVVFYLLLPSGLVPYLGWLTVPIALIIYLSFVMIEEAGVYLQDPFENRVTDTSMTAISRTIEINLRRQLGETELPEKLHPVDGVLM